MSRLYATVSSDAKGTAKTKRGHEEIKGQVLYGSKNDPKPALFFKVTWHRDEKRPTVWVRPYDVRLVVDRMHEVKE